MGANSKIQWCDHTFNPFMGCTKLSPGCAHCYAERDSKRFGNGKLWGPGGERRVTSDGYWKQPLRWNKELWVQVGEWRGPASIVEQIPIEQRRISASPVTAFGYLGIPVLKTRQRVFCGSMCDVFEERDDLAAVRERLWKLIEATPNLDWLLLTKRPENIDSMVWVTWLQQWPENVWIGTSVEDQQRADERIPELLKIPALVRFLSCEPLLGPIEISNYLTIEFHLDRPDTNGVHHYSPMELHGIDWVIAGGESGPEARAMKPEWVRALREQCTAAGVPFFFKQWGEWSPNENEDPLAEGTHVTFTKVGKKAAGRLLDGREWNEWPRV